MLIVEGLLISKTQDIRRRGLGREAWIKDWFTRIKAFMDRSYFYSCTG